MHAYLSIAVQIVSHSFSFIMNSNLDQLQCVTLSISLAVIDSYMERGVGACLDVNLLSGRILSFDAVHIHND